MKRQKKKAQKPATRQTALKLKTTEPVQDIDRWAFLGEFRNFTLYGAMGGEVSSFEYAELQFLAANIRKEKSCRLVSEHRAGHAPPLLLGVAGKRRRTIVGPNTSDYFE